MFNYYLRILEGVYIKNINNIIMIIMIIINLGWNKYLKRMWEDCIISLVYCMEDVF